MSVIITKTPETKYDTLRRRIDFADSVAERFKNIQNETTGYPSQEKHGGTTAEQLLLQHLVYVAYRQEWRIPSDYDSYCFDTSDGKKVSTFTHSFTQKKLSLRRLKDYFSDLFRLNNTTTDTGGEGVLGAETVENLQKLQKQLDTLLTLRDELSKLTLQQVLSTGRHKTLAALRQAIQNTSHLPPSLVDARQYMLDAVENLYLSKIHLLEIIKKFNNQKGVKPKLSLSGAAPSASIDSTSVSDQHAILVSMRGKDELNPEILLDHLYKPHNGHKNFSASVVHPDLNNVLFETGALEGPHCGVIFYPSRITIHNAFQKGYNTFNRDYTPTIIVRNDSKQGEKGKVESVCKGDLNDIRRDKAFKINGNVPTPRGDTQEILNALRRHIMKHNHNRNLNELLCNPTENNPILAYFINASESSDFGHLDDEIEKNICVYLNEKNKKRAILNIKNEIRAYSLLVFYQANGRKQFGEVRVNEDGSLGFDQCV